MNEQLQGKLVEILSAIQGAAKATGDFALSQLPDIAQQYVLYGRITTTIQCAFAVGAFLIAAFVLLRHSLFTTNDEWDSEERFVIGLVSGGLTFIFGWVMVSSISKTVLVWLAPKVWLMQEIAHMVK